ncbi:small fragment nuclease [Boleophthalmus pectinirostris]|uniref:small fragment nuclease n=1 Tax=Boleophthalmus pectinirostris TaxID=150288 RepID=UPI00242EAE5A|nr:small fragment nuclease [Boleophthalmus pectinirostris]
MPLRCSRTPAWSTLTSLYRRPQLVPRAARPSPPRHRCWSSLRTTEPLPWPLSARPAATLPLWSNFSFSKMSTEKSSSSSAAMSQRMVWVDLEMTGLDIEKDQIIEMACIITDSDLNVVAEGPNLIIKQPDELLDGMSDWCKEHHGKSGLTAAVRSSKISLEQAEYEFLSFVRQHTPPGQCPLAGNSVHADKRFLDKYMPQFMYHLHYRIIDVSTIKELCRRWFPDEYKEAPQKKASHRALGDIRESIKELQFYRVNVFKSSADEKKRKIIENGAKTAF